MPMIDVYATADNTAASSHDLPPDAIANAAGASNYVRVQVLTPVAVLDREKQLGVVKELTEIVASAAGDPTLVDISGRRLGLGAFGAGPRPVAAHWRPRRLSSWRA